MTWLLMVLCIGSVAVAGERSIQNLIDSGEIQSCFVGGGKLQLANKKLQSLQGLEQVPNAASITAIDLGHNEIRSLAGCTFENFPGLTHLWLDDNQLEDLSAIANGMGLENLVQLDLARNKIKLLPEKVFSNMAKLNTLVLNHNQISTTISAYDYPSCLAELHISHNTLQMLDLEKLRGLSMLYVLNLGFNEIKSIHPISNGALKNLEMLFLNNNYIAELPSYAFAACPRLQALYLQDNVIVHMQPYSLAGLVELRVLFLQNNFLTRLRAKIFEDLNSLKVLYMRNNAIEQFENDWDMGLQPCCVRDLSRDAYTEAGAVDAFEVKKILDRYKRPFTVLEIGGGSFALRIAAEYDCSAAVIEGDKRLQLSQACMQGNINNLIMLEKVMTAQDFKELSACEHFDVVFVHDMKRLDVTIDNLLALGDHVLIERDATTYLFEMSKNVLLKPTWGSPNTRFYAVKSNFTEKTLYKPRGDKTTAWQKGINLWTFKNLLGAYPAREVIEQEIKRLATFPHGDFFPWNIVIQGNHLELIDWDDNNAPGNMYNASACLAAFGS